MDSIRIATELIKVHEGLKLFAYEDTLGYLTIGYGHNLDAKGITPEAAEFLLKADILEVILQLNEHLSWWDTLSVNRQAVLIDMCFNLGIQGLLKFEHTLNLIRAGQFEAASEAMLQSLWARQVKGRARTLSQMMKEG